MRTVFVQLCMHSTVHIPAARMRIGHCSTALLFIRKTAGERTCSTSGNEQARATQTIECSSSATVLGGWIFCARHLRIQLYMHVERLRFDQHRWRYNTCTSAYSDRFLSVFLTDL